MNKKKKKSYRERIRRNIKRNLLEDSRITRFITRYVTSVLIVFQGGREVQRACRINVRHDCVSKQLKLFDSRGNHAPPPHPGAKVHAGRIRKYNVCIIKAISFVCSTMHRAPGDGIWCDSRCRHHSELEFR